MHQLGALAAPAADSACAENVSGLPSFRMYTRTGAAAVAGGAVAGGAVAAGAVVGGGAGAVGGAEGAV
jgi:hypothetical protein